MQGQLRRDLLLDAVFAETGRQNECHGIGLARGVVQEGYGEVAPLAEGRVADDDQIFPPAGAGVGPFQEIHPPDLGRAGGDVHSDQGAAPGQTGQESAIAGGGFNVSRTWDAGVPDKAFRQRDAFPHRVGAGVKLVQAVAVHSDAPGSGTSAGFAVSALVQRTPVAIRSDHRGCGGVRRARFG